MTDPRARLLVVDDDPISRGLIRHHLEAAGYALMEAEDCRTARQVIAQAQDLGGVLLARVLPDGDGLALLQQIRGMSAARHVPVIVQTAQSDAASVRDGLAAGAYFYLAKPVERALLLAVVGSAVAGLRELRTLQRNIERDRRALASLQQATFAIRTLDEATELSRIVAPLCPRPDGAVLVLQELLINAVEHGNLAISFDDKRQLVLAGRWHEEIEQRLRDPVLGRRRVTIHLQRTAARVQVSIADEGSGFDWQRYLELSPERLFEPHGRGIAMARISGVDELVFEGNGSRITATWSVPPG